MKILVTGSEGSLMQSVIPKLIANGHQIIGVDNLVRYGERPGHAKVDYEFHRIDLTDRSEVDELFHAVKPDYVIQAAARIYGIGGFNSYCADILGEDITLHNNVLRAAVENKTKRVVYISSSMVYENCIQDINIPVTEDMPDTAQAPYTEYGLSKFTGERLSIAFKKQYGLDYTIWRPFNIITPYEKVTTQEIGISHVFADFINNIVFEQMNPLPIIGDGEQIRCFTWIEEVAQAIADFSFAEKSKNEIFNLGNPEPISMKDLAKIIHRKAQELTLLPEGELQFETKANYKNDVIVRLPDVSKAKNVLGWTANQKVEGSIKQCLMEAWK